LIHVIRKVIFIRSLSRLFFANFAAHLVHRLFLGCPYTLATNHFAKQPYAAERVVA